MATEVLVKQGTAKTWRATGGDYALSLASVANNAARQGAKGDLGATRAAKYAVLVAIETGAAAPTAGTVSEIWWSASSNSAAGTDNAGGTDGTDSAYKAGEVDEWKVQLIHIGNLVMTNDATTIQKQVVGTFEPPTRYGMPVVVNKSGQTYETNNDEHFITLIPIVDEIQNA